MTRPLGFGFGFFVLLTTLLVGCPPAEKKEPPPCSKVGQTCTVAPGKLGTCVQKDDCSTPGGCFDCQSQH